MDKYHREAAELIEQERTLAAKQYSSGPLEAPRPIGVDAADFALRSLSTSPGQDKIEAPAPEEAAAAQPTPAQEASPDIAPVPATQPAPKQEAANEKPRETTKAKTDKGQDATKQVGLDIVTSSIDPTVSLPSALEVLRTKKNLRVMVCAPPISGSVAETRPISGGVLAQDADRFQADGDDPANWQLASGAPADDTVLADLAFAWRACRAAKSNAIVLACNGATVGVGMGQVNRVDSARLAVWRAGEERARGAVAASDAFFPFPDGLEVLIEAGVRAVVQPGGSVRDQEVIDTAIAHGVTMYFTGTRHFFH